MQERLSKGFIEKGDSATIPHLFEDLRKANRMLMLQKRRLLEEKNALKRWSEDLHLLNELSKSVVATLDAESIVLTAYKKTQKIVPHDILSVVLFKPKKLWVLSNVTLDIEDVDKIKALVMSAVREIADIPEDTVYKTAVKCLKRNKSENGEYKFCDDPLKCRGSNGLFFPMEIGGSRIGALQLIRDSEEPFSEHEYNIISMIVSTLTLALRNSEVHREVQEMATTDSLTGLFNKRYFCEMLAKEFKVSMRYQTPVSLMMIDLDNFKEINDRFGHQAGDAVLKEVSSLLARSLREIDVPVRYGGDEVAIILPETVMEQAFFAAKRIKKLLEERPVKFGKDSIQVTASFGISSSPNSGIKTVEEMIAAADKALYEAKRYGRNRIGANDQIFTHDNAYLSPLAF
ncbi:MAG TPA: GGDEF domain-containing protein [Nitrospirota bacterium]|nr:GGDEF domain-containing protein [Nitrospirota bacterium]